VRAHPCARLFASEALTIASVLPGVAGHYLDPGTAMECETAQLGTGYVRSMPRKRLKKR
jgi:hypothetical protein